VVNSLPLTVGADAASLRGKDRMFLIKTRLWSEMQALLRSLHLVSFARQVSVLYDNAHSIIQLFASSKTRIIGIG
jgi:hypothetical protein